MKLLTEHLDIRNRYAGHNLRILHRLLQSSLIALTMLAFACISPAQTLQVAGDLILNLQSVDLNGTSVWTNQTANVNGVGNMTTLNAGPLNVVSVSYGAGSINALYVNGTVGNAVESSNQVPSEILGNAPFSGEAWINADNLNGQDVMSYGNEGGGANPAQVRDMGYFAANYGAFTGNFGNSDCGLGPVNGPFQNSAGVWHYLAWTFDGTNVLAYQDGVLLGTGGSPLNTQPSLLTVGCNISQGGQFNGYIAAARLESGVLSASQITNNFNAGPLGGFGLVVNTPIASPGNSVFLGDTVTFTENALTNGPVTYQWYSDNGTGGATFTAIGGQTATTYVLNTSTLPGTGTNQYEVVVTGGTTVTSPPAILVVNAASAPVVSQNTTPSSATNFVATDISFSAAFVGNQTISYQWQKSTDNGVTFNDISSATAATLSLTNLQVSDSGRYRLHASNGLGSGNSTPATLTVLATRPALQVAGQLLVNLLASDLNTNVNTWTNEINGMGDFETVGVTNNLAVTNLVFDYQPIQTLNVNGIGGNAVQSLNQVPSQILGNSTYSAEGWVYVTAIGNSYWTGYGANISSPGSQARELGYGPAAYQGFTGYFGPDVGWTATLSVGWHYLACTWDGSTVRLYQDGQPAGSGTGTLITAQSVMWVGAQVGDGGPFLGSIAAARVESGVLSASQVANNYASGPNQTISIVVSPAMVSPGSTVFVGDFVTLSVTNVQSLQQSLTYQWQTDNGSSGASWSNISGATSTNYAFTASITGTNEYQLVVTGTSSVASAPVTLTIKPQAPPVVSADTSPSSASLFVGQQVVFTASFAGNQPITNQWQVSTDSGATFQNISGATGASLTITNLQTSNSGEYRLKASNIFGSGFSTPATLTVQPDSARPQVQFSGDLIVSLQSQDLTPGSQSWINRTYSTNSVGDFISLSTTTATLNITNIMYGFQPIQVLAVSASPVESADNVPNEIIGNSPFSGEEWVYATSTSANCAMSYGVQAGAAGPAEARNMNYFSPQGYGGFSANYGSSDVGWNPATTTGWHYLAWTYDGTTLRIYQDGVANTTTGGGPMNTLSSLLTVGCQDDNSAYFVGYVASARIESGVLTANQIAQNYATGPNGTISPSTLVPLSFTQTNGVLTLNWTPSSAAILLQSTNLLGPWVTNSSASAPYSVVPSPNVPKMFFRLQYQQ